MVPSTQAVTPLRQRMIDDMRMRKLCDQTQAGYIRAVRQLAAFLERSPDTATIEDLRRFQLHLVDHGTSPITLNATLSGLKFFFEVTLDKGHLLAKMQSVHVPRTLPVVLSRDEVARLLAAAPNLKHQTALSVAYATGLAIPFILVAVGATAVSHRLGWFRDHYTVVSRVTGAMLVLVGFLMITNTFARLSGLLPPLGA